MSAEQSKSSHAAAWIVSVIVALALYVLSVGPVVGLIVNESIPRSAVETVHLFYAPLGKVVDLTGTQPLLQRYGEWWIGMLRKP